MQNDALGIVEQGLRFAQAREAVLAADAASARTAGFSPVDVAPVLEPSEHGVRFAAALRTAPPHGASGAIEYAMGATAENSIRFRSLADQERAMLHEYRAVAQESRR